ncbi:hypothetical protein VNO77_23210 [Canavalia gladiata]|uniref:Uncharacterized protein n=1 Tax=Canavalia gladiata TaxID=3824 RepID=A0AAN9L417_CANGL
MVAEYQSLEMTSDGQRESPALGCLHELFHMNYSRCLLLILFMNGKARRLDKVLVLSGLEREGPLIAVEEEETVKSPKIYFTQSALRLQSEASTVQVLDLERLQWPQARNTPLETNVRAKNKALGVPRSSDPIKSASIDPAKALFELTSFVDS